MTSERKGEIIRAVFYRHIEAIMRVLESCEDSHVVFRVGMNMGRLHRDLEYELDKEVDSSQEVDV